MVTGLEGLGHPGESSRRVMYHPWALKDSTVAERSLGRLGGGSVHWLVGRGEED